MATASKSYSSKYQFVEEVPNEYLCQQCKQIARGASTTSCCEKCLCVICANQNTESCSLCGRQDFWIEKNPNFSDKIEALTVYCPLKDKGCEWTGALHTSESHLIKDCELNSVECSQCLVNVQKSQLDTHLTRDCPEREYTCKYCNFTATYRTVTEQHLDVCTYYIMSCPYRCGATFERMKLEGHMKTCAQQLVPCEFSYAGCEGEFQRALQKQHMEQNTQVHLALLATALRKQQQSLLDLASREKGTSFYEHQGASGSQDLGKQSHVQEVSLRCQYKDFETKIKEQMEQLLQERDQQIKALQRNIRKDDNPPEDLYQPWTCSMVLAVIASVLLAVLLGLHFQALQNIDADEISTDLMGEDSVPDVEFQDQLNDVREEITKLEKLIQQSAIDETAYKKKFTTIEEELSKMHKHLEGSFQEVTLNMTDLYTLTQEQYKKATENFEVKIQEAIKRLSEAETHIQSRDESRDKKVEELALTINGVRDLRGRVESIEQKMNDMGAKVALLQSSLSDLTQKFNDLPQRHYHGRKRGCKRH